MKRILSIFVWNPCLSVLVGTLGLVATVGCHSKQNISDAQQNRQLTVIVAEEGLYQRPDRLSQKVASLPFGQEVTAFEKKQLGTAVQGWEEVRVGKDLSGFLRSASLGAPEVIEKLRGLMKSIEGMEPQAGGRSNLEADIGLH